MSIDTPFTQNEFRDQNGLEFGLVSDDSEMIEKHGVSMDFADLGVHEVAKRAVFVVSEDDEVTYKWVSDDPGVDPDHEEVEEAASEAAASD